MIINQIHQMILLQLDLMVYNNHLVIMYLLSIVFLLIIFISWLIFKTNFSDLYNNIAKMQENDRTLKTDINQAFDTVLEDKKLKILNYKIGGLSQNM